MRLSKFRSPYLSSADVPHAVTVTVERVVEETIPRDGKPEKKAVLYFRGGSKGVVLSKTTIDQLTDVFQSDESNDWIGKPIMMFQDPEVYFNGRQTGGIRFRAVT